ncbi:uncharacterized protein [Euphorbia lathyris]|uniref:uncharacterized protein n=1 Tax=Euphorbia lathyris TaxID=212925 RepID=UPI0033139E15
MGGKGKRRREKNFKAAHGGYSRLPPPPNPSNVDALPCKLRQIMSFTSPLHDGSSKPSMSGEEKRKRRRGDAEKDSVNSEATTDDRGLMIPEKMDEGGSDSADEKKKKKRKRNQANDLRFETLVNTKTSQKKRERRKKYLESKKKKHKQSTTEDNLDFPGCEKIQFGDVVQAPPKLTSLPKGLKKVPDASQERVRLQAIDAYRKRKGWTSRPGLQLQLPNLDAASSL